MTTNIIDIEVIPKISRKNRTLSFVFKLKIDGEPINDNQILDMYGVLNLITRTERNYIYIWNCECGEPGCAGIEPITIKKKTKDDLTLFIPIPCSYKDYEEKDFQYWKINHKTKVLHINRNDTAKKLWDLTIQIEKIIQRLTKKLQLLEWPAHIMYCEFTWPQNMPVDIRSRLMEAGYSF